MNQLKWRYIFVRAEYHALLILFATLLSVRAESQELSDQSLSRLSSAELESKLADAVSDAQKSRVLLQLIATNLSLQNTAKAEHFLTYVNANPNIRQATNHVALRKYSYKVDSANENYREALTKYLDFKHTTDSISRVEKSRDYKNLEQIYQTEKMRNEIGLRERDMRSLEQHNLLIYQKTKLTRQSAALQKLELDQAVLISKKNSQAIQLKDQDIQYLNRQADIQQTQLRQEALIRNIVIMTIVLLTIIIILLVRQYRLKQRSAKEVTQKNDLLEQLVIEKNWLLKEMHHRVKNNLQTIVSLLESQSSFLVNSEALTAIQDSQNRVNAMSLIHQKLYQSENLEHINMASYLPELINYLKDSFDTQQRIRFVVDIQEIYLDVTQAIPVGLIINEAITNSIKYAFRSSKNAPQIQVQMVADDEQYITLRVADNGSGMPPTIGNTEGRKGLGMNLIRGLSEDIEANLSITTQDGVIIEMKFRSDIQPRQ